MDGGKAVVAAGLRRIAVAVFVTFVAPNLFAAQWEPIDFSGDYKSLTSFDPSSVVGSKTHRRAWIKTIYAEPQPGNQVTGLKSYDTTLALWYFDCPGQRATIGKLVAYSDAESVGQVVGSFTYPRATIDALLDDVVPGSVGAVMLRRVCSMQLKNIRPSQLVAPS